MKLKLTIQDAVYPRNGISGTEFYQLKDGINIHECWRGDHFEKALWEATAKFLNRKLLFG